MRKTKIVGFSIPPELHKKFEKTMKKTHKTKSEFFREMLDNYYRMSEAKPEDVYGEQHAARALQAYWNFRSGNKGKVITIGLAIIEQDGKVLIGSRSKKDEHVDNLVWAFPGGKMETLDFSEEMAREVFEETGLIVTVENLVAARIHPDSGFKDVQIVALYFHCRPEKKRSPEPKDGFTELKWVRPDKVFEYFSTSVSDDVTKFLMMLRKK